MMRFDLTAHADEAVMRNYLRENFTGEELAAVGETSHYYGYGVERLLQQVPSVDWVNAFLASESPRSCQTRSASKRMPKWLRLKEPDPAPVEDPIATKSLVRHLMELPSPVPIEELVGRWGDVPKAALGGAILQGIAGLVLFPTMRREDMTPMIGLWPPISQRLHRPKPSLPKSVKPQETFHGAFLLEDMTTLLVAAGAQPLRLRGNNASLFAKVERELQADLMPLPPWLGKWADYSPSSRLAVAMSWLQLVGLAKKAGVSGDDLRLEATDRGRQWLAKPAKERLKLVFDHFITSPTTSSAAARVPVTPTVADILDDDLDDDDLDDDDFDDDDWDDEDWDDEDDGVVARENQSIGALQFVVARLPFSMDAEAGKVVFAAVSSAMSALSDKALFPLEPFLQWQVQENNPLPALFAKKTGRSSYTNWSYDKPTAEMEEQYWYQVLLQTVFFRLLPFGCVRVGKTEGAADLYVGLAGPGRYLFGAAGDFDYGHDRDVVNQVVVQPNFDIVFLAPSPLAEARIGRFAERKARGVGRLFAITKKSIMAAAGTGMTASQVLGALNELSAKDIPANVAREITGWFDQCRRVTFHSAVLVRCPDAPTAARVASVGGKKAHLLTDTVVALTDERAATELSRKLNGQGIFATRMASFGPGHSEERQQKKTKTKKTKIWSRSR
jgi:hypothetical protein